MGYKIFHITTVEEINKYQRYFFDCNAWMNALRFGDRKPEEFRYEDFLNKIVKAQRKSQKSGKSHPKILVPPLLLSELVNTYMTKVAFKEYKAGNPKNKKGQDLEFKRDYRETDDYQEQLNKFISEFRAHDSIIEFCNHDFVSERPWELLQNLSGRADINDLLFYYFCVDQSAPIVTHDGDFLFQDIDILTSNKKLLAAASKSKSSATNRK